MLRVKKFFGRTLKIFLVILLIIALMSWGLVEFQKQSECPVTGDHTLIEVGNKVIDAEVVSTPDAREQGLSGKDCLPEDSGMLFVFEEPGSYCFWMKDMNFPIDMVWLNTDKQVVSLKESVDPSTYPETFCPSEASQYVLEVNGGYSQQNNLTVGQQLSW